MSWELSQLSLRKQRILCSQLSWEWASATSRQCCRPILILILAYRNMTLFIWYWHTTTIGTLSQDSIHMIRVCVFIWYCSMTLRTYNIYTHMNTLILGCVTVSSENERVKWVWCDMTHSYVWHDSWIHEWNECGVSLLRPHATLTHSFSVETVISVSTKIATPP